MGRPIQEAAIGGQNEPVRREPSFSQVVRDAITQALGEGQEGLRKGDRFFVVDVQEGEDVPFVATVVSSQPTLPLALNDSMSWAATVASEMGVLAKPSVVSRNGHEVLKFSMIIPGSTVTSPSSAS